MYNFQCHDLKINSADQFINLFEKSINSVIGTLTNQFIGTSSNWFIGS